MITVQCSRDLFLYFPSLMFIVHTVEMRRIMPVLLLLLFFFSFLLHPLGKAEEERSFHSVTAQCASRKWATGDTEANAVPV